MDLPVCPSPSTSCYLISPTGRLDYTEMPMAWLCVHLVPRYIKMTIETFLFNLEVDIRDNPGFVSL